MNKEILEELAVADGVIDEILHIFEKYQLKTNQCGKILLSLFSSIYSLVELGIELFQNKEKQEVSHED